MNVTDHIIKCNNCNSIIGIMSIIHNVTINVMGMPMRCMKCLCTADLDEENLTDRQRQMNEESLAEWSGKDKKNGA